MRSDRWRAAGGRPEVTARWGIFGQACAVSRFSSIDALVARMEEQLKPLERDGSPRAYFHGTYLRTTKAVGAEVAVGGFRDNPWVEEWDLAFAQLYLDAFEAASPPQPWAVAFDAPPDLPPLRHVLLGMNAHINYDLPQALLAVIDDASFDDAELLERREADHRHIDLVLADRVEGETRERIAAGAHLSLLDRLLLPLNKLGTKRFLAESRHKVWSNTTILAQARRAGPADYRARLGELEGLVANRVSELTRPGQVILQLAVQGFGVLLRP